MGRGSLLNALNRDGMHIWEDSYLIEIIDPQTLEPLPDGEEGELVLTTLTPRSDAVDSLPHQRFDLCVFRTVRLRSYA